MFAQRKRISQTIDQKATPENISINKDTCNCGLHPHMQEVKTMSEPAQNKHFEGDSHGVGLLLNVLDVPTHVNQTFSKIVRSGQSHGCFMLYP